MSASENRQRTRLVRLRLRDDHFELLEREAHRRNSRERAGTDSQQAAGDSDRSTPLNAGAPAINRLSMPRRRALATIRATVL